MKVLNQLILFLIIFYNHFKIAHTKLIDNTHAPIVTGPIAQTTEVKSDDTKTEEAVVGTEDSNVVQGSGVVN